MKLMTLNISGPSLERAGRIAEYLGTEGPDVVVLTETRDNVGTGVLFDVLESRGYSVVAPSGAIGGERGAAIAHRLVGARAVASRGVTLKHRLPMIETAAGVRIIGAYVPSRDRSPAKIERKRTFLRQLCRTVRSTAKSAACIVLGDLNIVSRDHWPKYSIFRPWEYDVFDEFAAAGLVDSYDFAHPNQQPYSWIGRTGLGYRYDYCFTSGGYARSVRSCRYDHDSRLSGISDHAAVAAVLDTAGQDGDGHETAPSWREARSLEPV